MLSERTETFDTLCANAHDSTTAVPNPVVVAPLVTSSIHDDVERLVQIAAQLFSVIERQIHDIEADLTLSLRESVRSSDQTVFKEHLIRSAVNLTASLQEVAARLSERSPTANDRARGLPTSFAR